MATIGSLIVNLVANTTQFSGGMKKGVKDVNAFEARVKAVSGSLKSFAGALGIAGGGFALGSFLKDTLQEAMNAENEMAQLNAVLHSTRHAAGLTAGQLNRMANSLQNVSKFSSGEVMRAQSRLLAFTEVKEVFGEATQTILDMSQALGHDLVTSTVEVGKALNNPITGITSLTRVGVQFTAKQKELIRSHVEAGRAAEAQRIILAQLGKEFGGSAAAGAETLSGKLTILSNKWKDLKQAVGQHIAPAVSDIADAATGVSTLGEAMTALMLPAKVATLVIRGQTAALHALRDDLLGVDKAAKQATGSLSGFSEWRMPADNGSEQLAADRKKFGAAMNAALRGSVFAPQHETLQQKRAREQREKDRATRDGLINTAFGSQFIGKNRVNVMGRKNPLEFNVYDFLGPKTTTKKPTPFDMQGRSQKAWDLIFRNKREALSDAYRSDKASFPKYEKAMEALDKQDARRRGELKGETEVQKQQLSVAQQMLIQLRKNVTLPPNVVTIGGG